MLLLHPPPAGRMEMRRGIEPGPPVRGLQRGMLGKGLCLSSLPAWILRPGFITHLTWHPLALPSCPGMAPGAFSKSCSHQRGFSSGGRLSLLAAFCPSGMFSSICTPFRRASQSPACFLSIPHVLSHMHSLLPLLPTGWLPSPKSKPPSGFPML